MVKNSPPRAPGDPQVPSGVGWGARASRHRPTDLKFVPQSENLFHCERPLSLVTCVAKEAEATANASGTLLGR